MSTYSKVVWSEGMFLKPQHFQQQDRYVERLVRQRVEGLCPYGWGFRSLTINRELLGLGKFALDQCDGIFPDGTPFDVPGDDAFPPPLTPSVGVNDTIVYLCVPLARRGAAEVDVGAPGSARFQADESQVLDAIAGSQMVASIRTARLRLALMLESDDRKGYQCLGVARVSEVGADGRITLDPDFVPPCLHTASSAMLVGFLNEVTAMLHHRGEALAPRVTGSSAHGVAEIADFLMLQMINRYEPLLAHLASLPALHPERLYALLVELAGELSTFTSGLRRPPSFPVYRHDDLEATFSGVMPELRNALSAVLEQVAVQIPLQDRKYGIRVGTLHDRSLLTNARLVLLVKASMPGETIRRTLPALVKIGSVEHIRDLVNSQLPGIAVQPLATAPRQIPYNAGAVYFELDETSPVWPQMMSSGGLAIHLAGEFPDVSMELWAIRR